MRNNNEYGEDINFIFSALTNDTYKRFEEYNLDSFDCGNQEINKFILNKDFLNIDNGITYGFFHEEDKALIGFAVLNCSGITCTPDNNYVETLPAIEILYFAIMEQYHGIQYEKDSEDDYTFSQFLFGYILNEISNIALTRIGARFVTLYSVPNAQNFYKKFEFLEFEKFMIKERKLYIDGCIPFCLPIE